MEGRAENLDEKSAQTLRPHVCFRPSGSPRACAFLTLRRIFNAGSSPKGNKDRYDPQLQTHSVTPEITNSGWDSFRTNPSLPNFLTSIRGHKERWQNLLETYSPADCIEGLVENRILFEKFRIRRCALAEPDSVFGLLG